MKTLKIIIIKIKAVGAKGMRNLENLFWAKAIKFSECFEVLKDWKCHIILDVWSSPGSKTRKQ